MTKQEILDRVVDHYITQNQPPGTENGGCMLRTSLGHRCAVGLFIPDEDYTEDLENLSVAAVIRRKLPLMIEHTAFLVTLQGIHDLASVDWVDADGAPDEAPFSSFLIERLRTRLGDTEFSDSDLTLP